MVISDIYFSWETITDFECAYPLYYGKQGSFKYMIYSLRGFFFYTGHLLTQSIKTFHFQFNLIIGILDKIWSYVL